MCFFCLQSPGEQRHVLLWQKKSSAGFLPLYNLIYSKTLAIVEPEVELTTKKTTELLNFWIASMHETLLSVSLFVENEGNLPTHYEIFRNELKWIHLGTHSMKLWSWYEHQKMLRIVSTREHISNQLKDTRRSRADSAVSSQWVSAVPSTPGRRLRGSLRRPPALPVSRAVVSCCVVSVFVSVFEPLSILSPCLCVSSCKARKEIMQNKINTYEVVNLHFCLLFETFETILRLSGTSNALLVPLSSLLARPGCSNRLCECILYVYYI